MPLPKYIQQAIEAGPSIKVSNKDKDPSFIGHPHIVERRGIADSKLQAAAMGYNVYKDENNNRVVLKTQPIDETSKLSVLLKGENIDTWGKANLARNSTNPLRKANARFVEPRDMEELEDKASKLYGRISKAGRNDTHHITGINSAARWKKSLEERRREPFEKRANAYGLYFGDHPRNQSSIPGERAINSPNLHQSVIHSADDLRSVHQLLRHFGLPSATHPKVNLVQPFQENFQYNTQREASALAGLAIERLGVQLAMLDKTSPGAAKTIKQSIDLIEKSLINTQEMGPINERPNASNTRALIEMLDNVKKNK